MLMFVSVTWLYPLRKLSSLDLNLIKYFTLFCKICSMSANNHFGLETYRAYDMLVTVYGTYRVANYFLVLQYDWKNSSFKYSHKFERFH